jgi:hypothetical protein
MSTQVLHFLVAKLSVLAPFPQGMEILMPFFFAVLPAAVIIPIPMPAGVGWGGESVPAFLAACGGPRGYAKGGGQKDPQ